MILSSVTLPLVLFRTPFLALPLDGRDDYTWPTASVSTSLSTFHHVLRTRTHAPRGRLSYWKINRAVCLEWAHDASPRPSLLFGALNLTYAALRTPGSAGA